MAPLDDLGLASALRLLGNVKGGASPAKPMRSRQGAARPLCDLSPDNRKPLKTERPPQPGSPAPKSAAVRPEESP